MSIYTTKLSGFTRKDLKIFDNLVCSESNVDSSQFQQTIKTYNGEFDPGSGRTLAACFIHASQGEPILRNSSKLANG